VDPLCLLIEPVASGDVEITDLPIVENEAPRWLVKGVLVVEDMLLQVMDVVFVHLGGNGSISFTVSNGLEEISDVTGLEAVSGLALM
jgi:hypothetical protein